MSWLLVAGLKNAILVIPLALFAWAVTRWSRRPALAHLVWLCVLVKLLTPPLIDVPVGWTIDVESWFATAAADQNRAPWQPSQASRNNRINARLSSESANLASPSNRPNSAIDRSRQLTPGSESRSTGLTWTTDARAREGVSPQKETFRSLFSGAVLLRCIGILWLAGSGVMLVITANRAWRFRRYLSLGKRRDEHFAWRVGNLAAAIGLKVVPRVIVVDGAISPMLWGLGHKTYLIFPAKLAERLQSSDLDALLLHELAHFARGDHWVRTLELAASILYWWHPVVWWSRRQIEAAEEECCDAWVLEHQTGTRHSYATALLATIDFLCEGRAVLPPAACGIGEVSMLRARLIQIMRGDVAAKLSRSIQLSILTLGIIVSPLEPALFATSNPQPAQHVATSSFSTPLKTPMIQAPKGSPARFDNKPNARPLASSRLILSQPVARSGFVRNFAMRPPSLQDASAVSPNGKFRIEAGTGRRTTLVNMDLNLPLDLTSHKITCVSFARNSHTFATGHEDWVIRLWDSATGGLLRSFRGCESSIMTVEISPDGLRVAAGSRDGEVLIWDMTTGDEVANLDSGEIPISCLRWSSRGDNVAISVGDSIHRGQPSMIVWSPAEGVILSEQPLREPAGAIEWIGKDEALLIAAWNGEACVWNPVTNEFLAQLHLEKDRVTAAAWSPDCPLMNRWLTDAFIIRTGI